MEANGSRNQQRPRDVLRSNWDRCGGRGGSSHKTTAADNILPPIALRVNGWRLTSTHKWQQARITRGADLSGGQLKSYRRQQIIGSTSELCVDRASAVELSRPNPMIGCLR